MPSPQIKGESKSPTQLACDSNVWHAFRCACRIHNGNRGGHSAHGSLNAPILLLLLRVRSIVLTTGRNNHVRTLISYLFFSFLTSDRKRQQHEKKSISTIWPLKINWNERTNENHLRNAKTKRRLVCRTETILENWANWFNNNNKKAFVVIAYSVPISHTVIESTVATYARSI